jgi:glycosyltransferase involved in cell wall biosynthesis
MRDGDFSIVITSHNQAAFIREAVDSALGQRRAAKEVIVVDDASSDGSIALLEKYGGNIVLVKLPVNRGACAARNAGASKANGTYLVFLDGDDVLLPWAIAVYDRLLQLKNPIIMLGTLRFFSGPVSAQLRADPPKIEFCEYEQLIKKDRSYRASASALVVHRETFLSTGGWSEGIFPMEDLDLIVKLGESGRTVQIISPPVTSYRMHAGNTVKQIRACMGMLATVIQKEKRREYPGNRKSRLRRYALIGGPAWFWVKKGFKSGAYREVLVLAWKSWLMIAAGFLRSLQIRLRGRRPIESAELHAQAREAAEAEVSLKLS